LQQVMKNDIYNPPFASARLNQWFSTYEAAKACLERQPADYLLPFRQQYFVCLPEYVEALGVCLEDPDLALAGHDWAHPEDAKALTRINTKIKASWKKNSW
jgi:hypothetical protein